MVVSQGFRAFVLSYPAPDSDRNGIFFYKNPVQVVKLITRKLTMGGSSLVAPQGKWQSLLSASRLWSRHLAGSIPAPASFHRLRCAFRNWGSVPFLNDE